MTLSVRCLYTFLEFHAIVDDFLQWLIDWDSNSQKDDIRKWRGLELFGSLECWVSFSHE